MSTPVSPSHDPFSSGDRPEIPRGHEEHGSVPSVTAPALYVLCLLLFIGSWWLFGYSSDVGSGLLWWVAMAMASLAFLLPLQLRPGVGRTR